MAHTSHDRLSQLPTEILALIFQQCTDFSSLWSLIHTSSRMSSVFNERACDIANAVLNTQIPSQTRAFMQAVLSMHNGTYRRHAQEALIDYPWCDIQLSASVAGTPSQIKWLIRLAHHVHVLAHMMIESCIQRCLRRPLLRRRRRYPEGFEIPTWTEEQRSLLGFWRLVFLNQLRIEGLKRGSLGWSSSALIQLNTPRPLISAESQARAKQSLTALDYIADIGWLAGDSEEALYSKIFQLPPIPKEREYGWVCKAPPPSWQAITQGREPGDNSQVWSQEYDLQPDYPPPRWFYGTSSSSSESESGLEDEGDDEEDDEEEEDEHHRGLICVLRDPSSSDGSDSSDNSDNSDNHEHLEIRQWLPVSWQTHPVLDFGADSTRQDESLNLDREPLGLQFWSSMVGSRNGGPGKYMRFDAYSRYGFALWEEQRMIELGLWSDNAIEDMSKYYQKWFQFLSPLDIACFKQKFRYINDDDYE